MSIIFTLHLLLFLVVQGLCDSDREQLLSRMQLRTTMGARLFQEHQRGREMRGTLQGKTSYRGGLCRSDKEEYMPRSPQSLSARANCEAILPDPQEESPASMVLSMTMTDGFGDMVEAFRIVTAAAIPLVKRAAGKVKWVMVMSPDGLVKSRCKSDAERSEKYNQGARKLLDQLAPDIRDHVEFVQIDPPNDCNGGSNLSPWELDTFFVPALNCLREQWESAEHRVVTSIAWRFEQPIHWATRVGKSFKVVTEYDRGAHPDVRNRKLVMEGLIVPGYGRFRISDQYSSSTWGGIFKDDIIGITQSDEVPKTKEAWLQEIDPLSEDETPQRKLWLYYRTMPLIAHVDVSGAAPRLPSVYVEDHSSNTPRSRTSPTRLTMDLTADTDEIAHAWRTYVTEIIAKSENAKDFEHVVLTPSGPADYRGPIKFAVNGGTGIKVVKKRFDNTEVMSLLNAVEDWVGCTGHQSFNEVVLAGKKPFYEVRAHMTPHIFSYDFALQQFLGVSQPIFHLKVRTGPEKSARFTRFTAPSVGCCVGVALNKFGTVSVFHSPASDQHYARVYIQEGFCDLQIDYREFIHFLDERTTPSTRAQFAAALPNIADKLGFRG